MHKSSWMNASGLSMSVECARCERYACRVARLDALPDTCPMHGSFPSFETLYGGETTRRMAYHSAIVEAQGYGRWTRLREILEIAGRLEIHRVGIGHCRDTRREAEAAGRYLTSRGAEVILPGETGECDPVGQADLFGRHATGLNVIVGMCVGHDALFIRHSRAPVTSLLVRDERLGHNPVAALYTRRSYLKDALYTTVADDHERAPFDGWNDDLLDRVTRVVRKEEEERPGPSCRVEEVMAFAREAGVRHLGIAFCVGLREEAAHLDAVLRTNGFRVSSSCCKTGSVPKERLGIRDSDKVRPGRPEMICNPVAQAELLDGAGVELVLLLGQCVGHDSATMAQLRAPAVCVVAKDRVLAHNTAAALRAEATE